MSKNELTTYLQLVRQALGKHPETNDIVQELQAHIWDLANSISEKTGCSVEEAFKIAIEQMEDPNVLAKSFQLEQIPQMWTEPKSVLPEKKLTEQEFVLLGIIGFFAATIILSVISWLDRLTDTNLGAFNFIFGLVQVAVLIALIVGFLYYRNEQEFKTQVEKLRDKFKKMQENDDEISDEMKIKLSALGLHLGGLFQIIWGILALLFTLYITFIAQWELFNEYWYTIGLIVIIFLSITEIIQGTIKMFVGEIRISRLIHSIVQIIAFMVSVILIVFYPLDIAGWFETVTNPTGRSIVNAITGVTLRPDYWFRILIGIYGVFVIMDAFYNLVKFGRWNPSQQKSLTIKQPLEEYL